MSITDELTEDERAFLDRHGFDAELFEDLRERYLDGELTPGSNAISGEVLPPAADDVVDVPAPGTPERAQAKRAGLAAIEAGEVGHVVLNGGMATRFGGVVKGVVEVTNGISFLGLKIRDANRWDSKVPVFLMNSFATDEATKVHLEENRYFGIYPGRVASFRQNIGVRLSPDGSIFRDADGASFYGPGHGDLPEALGRGTLRRFRERGGRYLVMSNVDNVYATLDPVVIGMHVLASNDGAEMTVEAAPRFEGDKGGMPARVDGDLQVVEAFRFPAGFDDSSIDVFNTNTFIFDAAALAQKFDLTWFAVEKSVGGQTAIQFERLAGELSAFLETQFLRVSREGDSSRFMPIKTPEDLESERAGIRRILRSRGILD